MADIRTPGEPHGDDRDVVDALRGLARQGSAGPDALTRQRHLRVMRRARLVRRPALAMTAAAAVVAVIAGVAIVGGGSDSSDRLAGGPASDSVTNPDAPRNLSGNGTDAVSTAATLPTFSADSPITPIPTERSEDYVILKVTAARAAAVESELVAALGRAVPTVGKTDAATTFVVPASVARKLSDTAGVSSYPDSPVSTVAEQTPVPSWGLDRVDAIDTPLDDKYSWTNSGTGSIVYVIDTGVYAGHGDFGGRVVSGYTAIDDGRGTDDCNGHGTHVAGTAAGQTYGIAKTAAVVAVRVLDCSGAGYSSGVVAGINWVAANHPGGPGVINMSLGGDANSAIDTAVNDAIKAGLVVVVAAGNSSDDACSYSPARVPGAITIGAIDKSDSRASYSNVGSCVDMWAPGTAITSAWISGPSASSTISGTSMASPHVAGLAARVLSMNPALSPTDVNARLVKTNGSATTPIVNLVETPEDTPTTTTTSTPDTSTTVLDTTTTSVPEEATTSTSIETTTTVPATTIPKAPRPGKSRRAIQPKEFAMNWVTQDDVTELVASWAIQAPAERYKITCTQLALGINAPIENEIEFDGATIGQSEDGKNEAVIALVPSKTLRCQLTAFVGSEVSAPSNPAIVPKSPRKPATSPTTSDLPQTTTTTSEPSASTSSSTTAPSNPPATNARPTLGNSTPTTATPGAQPAAGGSTTTTQAKKQGPPATTKKPRG